MKQPRHSAVIVVMTMAVSLLSISAHANPRAADTMYARMAQNSNKHSQPYMDKSRNADRSNDERAADRISRDQAAAIARDATGGRVLKVELKGNTWRVKVLLDGERVRTVRVDARTGELR